MGIYKIESHQEKSLPIPYVYKHLLREKIQKNHKMILDEDAIFNWINQTNRHFTTEKSLRHFLSRIPISDVLSIPSKNDEFFPCILFKGQFAWISVNATGHYRYFTKSEHEKTWMMDIFDLVEIQYGLFQEEVLPYFIQQFHIQCEEYNWKQKQRKKYEENESFIEHSLSEFPSLHQLICSVSSLLIFFNQYGKTFLFHESLSYKNQNLFFASSKRLSEQIQDMSYSKINKCLNLFSVLGLIEKVPPQQLPSELHEKATYSEEKLKKQSLVNFFIVHDFFDVAEEAERRASVLSEHRVLYSNLSKSIIEKLFGEEFAHSVYPQEIKKNRRRKNFQRKHIEEQLEKTFLKLLKQKGFVTKNMLQNSMKSSLSKDKKRQYIQLVWGYLIQKYNCIYRKPTKALKEKFSLTSSEYIAYRKDDADD